MDAEASAYAVAKMKITRLQYEELRDNPDLWEPAQLDYGFCLTRTPANETIEQGVQLLQELLGRVYEIVRTGKEVARVSLNLGKLRQARRAIKKVLEKEPDNLPASELKERIDGENWRKYIRPGVICATGFGVGALVLRAIMKRK